MAHGGSFSSRRGRSRLAPHATINVTSLLDITMVLLISFMIIAPTLQSGITVDLPEVEESKALNPEDNSVVLSVARAPETSKSTVRILLNDEEVALDTLRQRLEDLRKERPRANLVVQGDKTVPWQEMAQVIAAVQASGLPGMSLVTIPIRDAK